VLFENILILQIGETKMKRILTAFALILSVLFAFNACSVSVTVNDTSDEVSESSGKTNDLQSTIEDAIGDYVDDDTLSGITEAVETLDEDGSYFSKDEVALYIYSYGKLPSNFITKKEAEKLGWEGGSLEPYAPGKAIGGDHFGNYEGALPEKDGRTYTECDIDTEGAKSRGAKRIVFSNDGLIYYTDDHYESFELLYGEE
jgi:ribonuclease T1